jgi:hypothetical protein
MEALADLIVGLEEINFHWCARPPLRVQISSPESKAGMMNPLLVGLQS